MTDIEQKAQSLFSQVLSERGAMNRNIDRLVSAHEALFRAIEQHEAFRQEVSDAAQEYEEAGYCMGWEGFERFIILKPDPLVKVLNEISHEGGFDNFNHYAHRLRAALEARGLEIREKTQ